MTLNIEKMSDLQVLRNVGAVLAEYEHLINMGVIAATTSEAEFVDGVKERLEDYIDKAERIPPWSAAPLVSAELRTAFLNEQPEKERKLVQEIVVLYEDFVAQQYRSEEEALSASMHRCMAQLVAKRDQGYSGWKTECDARYHADRVLDCMKQGRLIDAINFLVFLDNRDDGKRAAQQAVEDWQTDG